MKATEFCYWLQGYFEIAGVEALDLSKAKVDLIKQHLQLVFIHDIDPSYPKNQQADLYKQHGSLNAADPQKILMRC